METDHNHPSKVMNLNQPNKVTTGAARAVPPLLDIVPSKRPISKSVFIDDQSERPAKRQQLEILPYRTQTR